MISDEELDNLIDHFGTYNGMYPDVVDALQELEMDRNWLAIYGEKLKDVPGDSLGQKIDILLEERNALITVESNVGLVEGTWKIR